MAVRRRKALIACSVGILCFSIVAVIVQTIILANVPAKLERVPLTAKASLGYVTLCLNNAPNVTFPCNATLSQNQTFTCQLNGTDVDGQNLTFTLEVVSGDPFLNVSASGYINVTPSNDDVGNHTIMFFVDDGLDCDNSIANTTVDFEVANINDPPYLVQDIPDQQFNANTTLSAFFLSDYFADPDGDPLDYTSVTSAASLAITILPTSEVRFTSNVCGTVLVRFIATDPSNASATSNVIEVEVSCDTGGGGAGDEESGSGGGGGGANICLSNWQCEEWFACLPAGFQWQRCYDVNGCEVDRYLKRQCEYEGPPLVCEENWLCGEWGVCMQNNTQVRACDDLNTCGTDAVRPPLVQECVYAPTCDDGVQNGDEEGVDCGGSCPACALVQRPTLIESRLSAWVLAIVLLCVLIASAVARYYRAELAQALATLGFLIKHRVVKDVLLDAPQRKSQFERILAFEQREEGSIAQVYDDLAMLIRGYFHEALALPVEALPEEIEHRIGELGLRTHTRELLLALLRKLGVLEQDELIADDLFVLETLEELRTAVCLTSQYEQGEILRQMEDIPVTEEMSFYDEMFARMVNVLRAVQFDQIDTAKKEYVRLLEAYGGLSEEDREAIYPELQWVFQATRLQSEVSGARIVVKP